MQLMAVVVPTLEAIKKEGESGRRKITQYTRYGTVFLALIQAVGISVALESQPGLVIDPGMMFRFTTIVTLVTGTMFIMWLGEQIRSEEHTSELQSLMRISYAVFCLKKKTTTTRVITQQMCLTT